VVISHTLAVTLDLPLPYIPEFLLVVILGVVGLLIFILNEDILVDSCLTNTAVLLIYSRD